MSEQVRTGEVQAVLVGCGQIAASHLEAARHLSGAYQYTGVLDADHERAVALAGRFTVPRVYKTWQEVLLDPKVEAVDLCLPHHLHHSFAVEAMEAGKHVLVEKPIAVTVAEASAMIAAANRHGRVLMPVHNWLYMPTTLQARETIAQGSLGEIYLVEIAGIQDPATVGVRPWLARQGLSGGGVAIAQTIHFLYTALSLLGDVRRVSAYTSTKALPTMETEATLSAALEFVDGTLGAIASTFAQGAGAGELRLTVYGSEGLLHFRVASLDVVSPTLFGDDTMHTVVEVDPADPLGFTALLADFAATVRGAGHPLVTPDDGRRALAVVEAAYRSAREGTAIDVVS